LPSLSLSGGLQRCPDFPVGQRNAGEVVAAAPGRGIRHGAEEQWVDLRFLRLGCKVHYFFNGTKQKMRSRLL